MKKKIDMKQIISLITFFLIITLGGACKQEMTAEKSMSGTWVSESPADTIVFLDSQTFTKSVRSTFFHTFGYSFVNDSITIQYKGPNKILVNPSTHYFSLVGNSLTIDLSNGCYGFENRKMVYVRTK